MNKYKYNFTNSNFISVAKFLLKRKNPIKTEVKCQNVKKISTYILCLSVCHELIMAPFFNGSPCDSPINYCCLVPNIYIYG